MKRRLEGDTICTVCSPNAASGLEQLFAISPFASALLSRTFLELDNSVCELLNENWRLQPQLQYACAQILAGLIFLNTRSGKSAINNTVSTLTDFDQLQSKDGKSSLNALSG